ncbi:uncharacterized protein A1O9_04446 [Exophiala aquamarina CBS 119918]|uniref:3-oxoacyl-[acyl-carrier protein] reductase n=1 Tax=Exophiala aquamarina CBS 119918 TaxID=1182545 RepID=A0A072PVJ7_9EURO|nr:uncharacterized protein A1O9_04446 [Exophiala aquamarina CBS 119918]KEF59600.1 hypothetical protein A1O9_04446 [Exophiala aquamarina CBS 119918]
MPHFSGVALVIGAGSSYGKAVTRLLIENGCMRLIVGDTDETELANLQAECRALDRPTLRIISKKCDTRVAEDLEYIVELGVAEFGAINYCANCERLNYIQGTTTDISPEEFNRAGDTWQKGIWLAMRAQVRQFNTQRDEDDTAGTSIVNITAAQGLASDGGFPSYCAAAHGIVGMSRATAMDYLKKGIRINCVCPGPTENPGTYDRAESGSLPQAPIGRYIAAEEVAHAVVFLLGEGASGITGIELPVDGGWSLYHH